MSSFFSFYLYFYYKLKFNKFFIVFLMISPQNLMVFLYIRKVSSMRVVQIITAGGKGEQVQEKEGHGLFTTYFLRALEGEADINKDNVVTGTELGAYLRPTVSNASKQAQTPLYGRLEGEGEFLFSVGKK